MDNLSILLLFITQLLFTLLKVILSIVNIISFIFIFNLYFIFRANIVKIFISITSVSLFINKLNTILIIIIL